MEKLPFVSINQPMKIFKSKSLPGLCAICNNESSKLRNIEENHTFKGEIENYTKMLLSCFNIKIYHFQEEEKFNTDICERCVSRLKDAYYFRKQVEAGDERLGRRTRSSESTNTMMQIILNKYSNESGRDDTLRRILMKKRIKSEILEKLKISNETRFSNCLIRKKSHDEKIHKKLNRLEKSKKKKDKKNLKLKKKGFFKNDKVECLIKTEDADDLIENTFHGDFDTLFEQSDEDESIDSADIKASTGFEKQDPIIAKKEIFLIPALENSAKFCPICEMVPNSRQSLLRHYYDTHFPSFLCHLCGYGTTLRDSFTGHMKTHRGVKYSCSSCAKTFFSPISRYHHEKAIHRKIPLFSCTMCKATFSHSVTRRKHMFEKHGVECAKHACTDCGKVFYSGHRLSVHVKRSHLQHRPFSCSVCGYSFFQNCDLRDHMTKHTGAKDFNCDQCGKCFSRRACLMEHLKIHANIRNFRCELCDKTFVQKVSLKGHMKTHERNPFIDK